MKKILSLVLAAAVMLSVIIALPMVISADEISMPSSSSNAATLLADYSTNLLEISGTNVQQKSGTWITNASQLQTYDDLVANGFTAKETTPYVTYYVDAPAAGTYGFRMAGWFWGYGDGTFKVISVNDEQFIKTKSGNGDASFNPETGDYFELELKEGVNFVRILFYTGDGASYVIPNNPGNNTLWLYAFDTRLTVIEKPEGLEPDPGPGTNPDPGVITMPSSSSNAATLLADYSTNLLEISGTSVQQKSGTWITNASQLQNYDDLVANGFLAKETTPYVTYYVDAPAAGAYGFRMDGWFWGYGDGTFKVISVNDEQFIKTKSGNGDASFNPETGDYFELELKEGVNFVRILFYTGDGASYVIPNNPGNNTLWLYAFDTRLTVIEKPEGTDPGPGTNPDPGPGTNPDPGPGTNPDPGVITMPTSSTPAKEYANFNTNLMEISGNNVQQKMRAWITDASQLQTYDNLVANGFTKADTMPCVTYYVNAPAAGTYGFRMSGYYWGYNPHGAFKVVSVNDEQFLKTGTGSGSENTFKPEDQSDYFEIELKEGVNFVRVIFYTAEGAGFVTTDRPNDNALWSYAFDTRLTVIEKPEGTDPGPGTNPDPGPGTNPDPLPDPEPGPGPKPVLMGDANNDGKVNLADLIRVKAALADDSIWFDAEAVNFDNDEDCIISNDDVNALRKYILANLF